MKYPLPIHGRGAAANPANRFEVLDVVRDYEQDPELDPSPRTIFLRDRSNSVISSNDSPDIPYGFTLNPYRGCEHGCIYCYARPTHEYLGFSAGVDFETRIMVKSDAPELLRRVLSSPKWQPQPVAMSGVTDCYQPVERKLAITRHCLQIFAEFGNPVWITTKNKLVTRDLDVLASLAANSAAAVQLSITTLDSHLSQHLEPRTTVPRMRLEAIRELAAAGVPTGVIVAPIIPGLTDHEIPQILSAARDAGARFAFCEMLRLPYAVKDLFVQWLQQHFPDRADKVISRIRQVRGGYLNDATFGQRMTGTGLYAQQILQLFQKTRKRLGLADNAPELNAACFHRPGDQPSLFP